MKQADSPVRFIGFAVTAVFVGACLITKKPIQKRELLLLVFLGLTQLFCNRFEDVTAIYTWQFAATTAGVLWHRIPLHPKVFAWMAWIFVVLNLGATIQKPGWAFFRAAEDGNVLLGRLAGCTSHPNEMGAYAGVMALIVALNVRTPGWRLLWAGLILLLLLSGSKTSALCYLVAFVCYRKNWRMPIWFAVSIPIASIAYAVLAASGIIGGFLSLTGRTNLWTVLIEAFETSPVIGLGPFGVQHAAEYAKVGFEVQNHAHDAALQVLVQGGLIGFTCYCIFMVYAGKSANRSLLGSAIAMFLFIHSFTESTVPWMWPFPLLYASCFTLKSMRERLEVKAFPNDPISLPQLASAG